MNDYKPCMICQADQIIKKTFHLLSVCLFLTLQEHLSHACQVLIVWVKGVGVDWLGYESQLSTVALPKQGKQAKWKLQNNPQIKKEAVFSVNPKEKGNQSPQN